MNVRVSFYNIWGIVGAILLFLTSRRVSSAKP